MVNIGIIIDVICILKQGVESTFCAYKCPMLDSVCVFYFKVILEQNSLNDGCKIKKIILLYKIK